jgi:hypothetical protein
MTTTSHLQRSALENHCSLLILLFEIYLSQISHPLPRRASEYYYTLLLCTVSKTGARNRYLGKDGAQEHTNGVLLPHPNVHIFRSNFGYSISAYQFNSRIHARLLSETSVAICFRRPHKGQAVGVGNSNEPIGSKLPAFSTTCFSQAFADKAEPRVAMNFV